jgi:hypothetical protein
MPGAKTHAITGLITSTIVFSIFKPPFLQYLLTIPLLALTSILPDVDHYIAKARKIIILIISSLTILIFTISITLKLPTTYYLIGIICGITTLTIINSKHRKWFHTLPASILTTSPLIAISIPSWIAGITAYTTHTTIDKTWSWLKRKVQT